MPASESELEHLTKAIFFLKEAILELDDIGGVPPDITNNLQKAIIRLEETKARSAT